MLLALALCRVRRILGGSGWRRAEPGKRPQSINCSGRESACKGQLRRVRRTWEGRRAFRNEHASLVDGKKSRQLRAADAGVYDHLRRGKPTGTLVALCGLHHLMDSQMSILGSKT
jgi:hypothetical protein